MPIEIDVETVLEMQAVELAKVMHRAIVAEAQVAALQAKLRELMGDAKSAD